MAADAIHRKLNKYEWSECILAKGAVAQPGAVSKEVLGAAIACLEKKVFICGGYDPRTGRSLSQVVEFDLLTKQWTRGPQLPEKRRNAAAVAFGNYCFLFGGWNDEKCCQELWMLAPTSAGTANTGNKETCSNYMWSLVHSVSPTPSARVCHSMVLGVLGDDEGVARINVAYLFGGFDGERRLNDVWRLRLDTLIEQGVATWEQIEINSGTPPSPRDDAAVAFDAAAERLLVFGGFASCLQSDLHVLSLRGGQNKWMCQPCVSLPSRRQGCVAAVSNGYLVVCLGEDEKGPLPQILQLSLVDFKWSLLSLEKEDLIGRKGCVGCVSEKGKRIIMFGGCLFPKVNTSILELELEKVEGTAVRKK